MIEKMERMERKKLYYLLANQKQTLVSCSFNGKEIDTILKFDGIDWVPDKEVDEVVRRCYNLDIMDKIAKKVNSDYEYDKILNSKRQFRRIADEQAQIELLERIEKRDAEKNDANSGSDDTKK